MPNETNVVSLPETCNIRLYRYYGEPNKLDKSNLLTNFDGSLIGLGPYGNGDYLAGTMKTPLDFINPTFFVESDKGFPWNYLRFQDTISVGDQGANYGVKYRYYFITSVTCLNAGKDGAKTRLYRVECTEDVLFTFMDIIKEYGIGMIERNEFEYNTRLPDNNRVFQLGQYVENIPISNDLIGIDENNKGIWVLHGLGLGGTST